MYTLYKETLTVKNYHRMTDAQAEVQMMTLKETLPGFLDAQGSNTRAVADTRSHQDAWIASFMEYADMILATHRVQADLVPNFMILSTTTARSIQTTQIAEFRAPDETSRSVNNFMRKSTGDNDLLLSLRPVSLRQFQGVNIIPLAPYNTDEGLINSLEEVHTFGMFHYLHLNTWDIQGNYEWWRTSAAFTIPDFEKRNDRTFRILNPNVPVESTWRGTHAPIANGELTNQTNPFVVFRKNMNAALPPQIMENESIRFLFYSTLLRFLPYHAEIPHWQLHTQGESFMHKLISYYEKFYHMLDTWTVVPRKRENDNYHVFTRITSIADFRLRYNLFLSTVERSGDEDGNHIIAETAAATAESNRTRIHVSASGLRAEHFFSMSDASDRNRTGGAHTENPAAAASAVFVETLLRAGGSNKERYDDSVRQIHAASRVLLASGVNTCHENVINVMENEIGCCLSSNAPHRSRFMAAIPVTEASSFQFLLDVLFLVDKKDHAPIFVPSVTIELSTPFQYATQAAVDTQTDKLHLSTQETANQIGLRALINDCVQLHDRANTGTTLALAARSSSLLRKFHAGLGQKNVDIVQTIQTIKCRVPVVANYENLLVIRPKVRLATETILYGIGGKVTGVTALGQERYEEAKRYTEQDEQFRVKMRMAVCLAHPEHIIRMESAKYRRYIEGATASVFTAEDFVSNASDQFSTPQRKRVPTNPSKDAIIMALPEQSAISTADMTNFTTTHPITHNDVMPHLMFRDINTSVIPGKHVGIPFMESLIAYANVNAQMRAQNDLLCSSYILVGNGMIQTQLSTNCTDDDELKAFAIRADAFVADAVWTVKAVPEYKPAKTDVLCWESQISKAEINAAYRLTANDLNVNKIYRTFADQLNHHVSMAAARVIVDHDVEPYNAALQTHIHEHVSRGPFRFMSPKTAVDVWNGRSMQSAI